MAYRAVVKKIWHEGLVNYEVIFRANIAEILEYIYDYYKIAKHSNIKRFNMAINNNGYQSYVYVGVFNCLLPICDYFGSIYLEEINYCGNFREITLYNRRNKYLSPTANIYFSKFAEQVKY